LVSSWSSRSSSRIIAFKDESDYDRKALLLLSLSLSLLTVTKRGKKKKNREGGKGAVFE